MESHFCTVSQIFLAIPIMNPLARVHDSKLLLKKIFPIGPCSSEAFAHKHEGAPPGR